MSKYWLFLHSYTFVFHENSKYLFYNTLTGDSFETEKTNEICGIVDKLILPNNMYCVEFDPKLMHNTMIDKFIKDLRKCYCGDLIPKSYSKGKPVIFYPKSSVFNHKKVKNKLVNKNLSDYLNEVTIYISSDCNLNCANCNEMFKQFKYCTKKNGELTLKQVETFIEKIKFFEISKINIIGGDITLYENIDSLMKILNNLNTKKTLYFHYKHNYTDKAFLKNYDFTTFNCIILIDFSFNKNELKANLKYFEQLSINYTLQFIVTNESEFLKAENFCESQNIKDCQIIPFYSKYNYLFFQNYVFTNKEDILNSAVSKSDIYLHKYLNVFYFGKLTIMQDGKIFANVNKSAFGNLNSDLQELVELEINDGTSWLGIRSDYPCNDCVFQWLCPSPNNYEIAIGQPNLCHVKQMS